MVGSGWALIYGTVPNLPGGIVRVGNFLDTIIPRKGSRNIKMITAFLKTDHVDWIPWALIRGLYSIQFLQMSGNLLTN